jgi:hypothetical protein
MNNLCLLWLNDTSYCSNLEYKTTRIEHIVMELFFGEIFLMDWYKNSIDYELLVL